MQSYSGARASCCAGMPFCVSQLLLAIWQAKFSATPGEAAWFLPVAEPGSGGAPVEEAAPVEEVPVVAAPVKTHFDVKLKSFDAAQKLKVIKEVRAITNLGLKEVRAMQNMT